LLLTNIVDNRITVAVLPDIRTTEHCSEIMGEGVSTAVCFFYDGAVCLPLHTLQYPVN